MSAEPWKGESPKLSLFDPQAPSGAGPSGPTVSAIIQLYLAALALRVTEGSYTAHAYDDCKRELERFAGRHGHKAISECRRFDVTEWLQINPQWRRNNTRKRVVSAILSCFGWAEDEELIEKNPYRRPKRSMPSERRRPAEYREYVALMRQGSRPLRRALFFLRRTGARPCEMRELRIDEVFVSEGIIRKQKHKTLHATGKPRLIGLDASTARFLGNLLRKAKPGQTLVFVNSHGRAWDRHTFARHLRRYAERIGLDDGVAERVSAGCFRHTFTVQGIEGGASDREIADQLGHTSTRMVSWYGAQSRERTAHVHNVAEKINRRRKK